jgi:hypothetical protein
MYTTLDKCVLGNDIVTITILFTVIAIVTIAILLMLIAIAQFNRLFGRM